MSGLLEALLGLWALGALPALGLERRRGGRGGEALGRALLWPLACLALLVRRRRRRSGWGPLAPPAPPAAEAERGGEDLWGAER